DLRRPDRRLAANCRHRHRRTAADCRRRHRRLAANRPSRHPGLAAYRGRRHPSPVARLARGVHHRLAPWASPPPPPPPLAPPPPAPSPPWFCFARAGIPRRLRGLPGDIIIAEPRGEIRSPIPPIPSRCRIAGAGSLVHHFLGVLLGPRVREVNRLLGAQLAPL